VEVVIAADDRADDDDDDDEAAAVARQQRRLGCAAAIRRPARAREGAAVPTPRCIRCIIVVFGGGARASHEAGTRSERDAFFRACLKRFASVPMVLRGGARTRRQRWVWMRVDVRESVWRR